MSAIALLVTGDLRLRASVEKALASVENCALRVIRRWQDLGEPVDGNEPTVVLFHLAEAGDEPALMSLVARARATGGGTAIVPICDRYETLQAVKLLSGGAADYLARPLDLRRLAFVVDMLTFKARHGASAKVAEPESALRSIGGGPAFHYHHQEEMAGIVEQVRLLAPLSTTVLLTGESGTGKSRLARQCHELSPRRSEPFVAINCGALTPSLIESEMFGHVKGAFTGAETDRAGKFTAAGNGTLLLDDIDALPLAVQAKLLRAIDERVFEPVGSNTTFPLKARFIVATNGSLEAELAAGRFRSDLFFRINVVSFRLPPLRERRSVIASLIKTFSAEITTQHGRAATAVSPQALAALEAYDWPGNIRELRNVLERAIALYPGKTIEIGDLPLPLQRAADGRANPVAEPASSKLHEARFDAEFRTLRNALGKTGNNRSLTARHLGISRVTLYKKLHKYDLI